MQRKLNIEEIRRFFDTANNQFEESGLFLLRVRFNRDEYGYLQGIAIDYERRENTEQKENEH